METHCWEFTLAAPFCTVIPPAGSPAQPSPSTPTPTALIEALRGQTDNLPRTARERTTTLGPAHPPPGTENVTSGRAPACETRVGGGFTPARCTAALSAPSPEVIPPLAARGSASTAPLAEARRPLPSFLPSSSFSSSSPRRAEAAGSGRGAAACEAGSSPSPAASGPRSP